MSIYEKISEAQRKLSAKKDNMFTMVFHPHLITKDTYKCYTWKQLWKKIQHNKSAEKFKKFLELNAV